MDLFDDGFDFDGDGDFDGTDEALEFMFETGRLDGSRDAWREQYALDELDHGVDAADYESEAEYLWAVNSVKQSWLLSVPDADQAGLDPLDYASEDEFAAAVKAVREAEFGWREPYQNDWVEHGVDVEDYDSEAEYQQAVAEAGPQFDVADWPVFALIAQHQEAVSTGASWHRDCPDGAPYELDPAWFASASHYRAACAAFYSATELVNGRVEAGIFAGVMQLCQWVLESDPSSPWYYLLLPEDAYYTPFTTDLLAALRANNPRYQGKLLATKTLDEVFEQLIQRNLHEAVDCFLWLDDFFAPTKNLYKFIGHHLEAAFAGRLFYYGERELPYVLCQRLELLPKLLAQDEYEDTVVFCCWAKAAAGMYRIGKKREALALYQRTLTAARNCPRCDSSDLRKLIDIFVERLRAGYGDEPFLDQAVINVLETQLAQYVDEKWRAKYARIIAIGRQLST